MINSYMHFLAFNYWPMTAIFNILSLSKNLQEIYKKAILNPASPKTCGYTTTYSFSQIANTGQLRCFC